MTRQWRLNRYLPKPWQKATVALTLLSAGLFAYVNSSPLDRPLNDKEQAMLTPLLQHPTPRCVGLYLIDLPADFIVDEGMFLLLDDRTKMESREQYRPPFNQLIQRREQELKTTETDDPLDKPFLKKVHPLPEGMVGTVFERNENSYKPDVARILEAYKWDAGVTFKIEMKARDGRSSRYDLNRSRYGTDVFNYNVPEKLTTVQNLLRRTTAREDTVIPNQPGFCIRRGFIAGKPIESYDFGMGYVHSHVKNLVVGFSSNDYQSTGDTLLEQDERVIGQGKYHTLHKGKREINGLAIEEWLLGGEVTEREYITPPYNEYFFYLKYNQLNPTAQQPRFEITLYYKTENLTPEETLSEAQLTAVWKAITSTLRIRPGAI
ncbi:MULTISPECIES: T6SS immunity protein Tli4 family protein [unclassified Serratia (in: enterobacteria)]|uniref:T6SS immunity protein Tli4 family protein n=1 Tax=unclassified Serratia (in: enterobacteria) TaxID=2647522 RepID=UPI0005020397|nr:MULTISPECIES: T6SS immunity protein Tli4 family protein [unclassified Serratia (in: enterobacteria)]KFK91694.1 hypothetical protein JV45_24910 [Serratia sp. Ag2]KFK93390.1 hypothetical protein IV04_23965 [Serratia sp. Ag1]